MSDREFGIVKSWREGKGFGFIGRSDGGPDVFCHIRDTESRTAIADGSKVSYVYTEGPKGGNAKEVRVEEAIEEDDSAREFGTVKRYNAEKGFAFIGRSSGGDDAFAHKRDFDGKEFVVGQTVSFVFEEGPKGAAAKKIRQEEGSFAEETQEDEGEREFGTVKSYNTEKGFAFIGRSIGGDDLFAHKKEFGGVEPRVGQPVSFIVEAGDKGDSAKKIREEDSIPEVALSDEGREFGNVKTWIEEKGFGFIGRKNGGDDCYVHSKQCNGLTMEKGMCISFVYEDGDKGPSAKDIRKEDPERVARVTAKKVYGTVKNYFDPTDDKPENGFGFIVPLDPPKYGAALKYYFHKSNIVTPDHRGGLDPGDGVSFIVVPAKKGLQAAAVTKEDPPKPEPKPIETSMATLKVGDTTAAGDGWGNDTATAGNGAGHHTATAADGGWGDEAIEPKAGGGWDEVVTEPKANDGWGDDATETKANDGWGDDTAETKGDDGWGNDTTETNADNGWGNDATDTQADNDGWGDDPAPAAHKENQPPAKHAFKKEPQPPEDDWGSNNTW